MWSRVWLSGSVLHLAGHYTSAPDGDLVKPEISQPPWSSQMNCELLTKVLKLIYRGRCVTNSEFREFLSVLHHPCRASASTAILTTELSGLETIAI